jgi:V/A-type H+-transporting ATPase subunit I
MIVKMKKLSLLLYHAEKVRFLAALQELGVVHIEENPERDATALTGLSDQVKRCEAAVKALKPLAAAAASASGPAPDAVALLSRLDQLDKRRGAAEQELAAARKDEALLLPWGEFDPALFAALNAAGLRTRFCRIERKRFDELKVGEGALVEVSRGGSSVYALLLFRGESAPVEAEEVPLPREALSAVRARAAKLESELAELRQQMSQCATHLPQLQAHAAGRTNELRLREADLDMQSHAEGTLVSVAGWVPVERVKALQHFLAGFAAWYTLEAPQASDSPPILVKNGPFTRLFEPLLKLYSLPAYMDMDPTVFFAPFFMLFVGLCLGDVAYGSIILIAGLVGLRLAPAAFKPIAVLVVILGGMTILCGALLNSFFGQTLFGSSTISGALLPVGGQYAVFTPITGADGRTSYPMMSFALLVGFIQVMLAFVIRSVVKIRNGGIVAGLPPIAFMMLTIGGLAWAAHVNFLGLGIAQFNVSGLHLGSLLLVIPVMVAKVITLGGVVVFFVFANADKAVGMRITFDIIDFYNTVTGIFGNILSYLRLFALGLSGGMLGAVFNQLAFGLIKGPDGHLHWLSFGAIGTVLLLVAGHGLNLLFSMVGAFVHPLRLTFVEFMGNLDFAWGGKPYRPLAKTR